MVGWEDIWLVFFLGLGGGIWEGRGVVCDVVVDGFLLCVLDLLGGVFSLVGRVLDF